MAPEDRAGTASRTGQVVVLPAVSLECQEVNRCLLKKGGSRVK